MTEIDEQTPSTLSKLKFAIGLFILKIGEMFLGEHLLVFDNGSIKRKKARFTERPDDGVWFSRGEDAVFIPGDATYRFGSNKVGLLSTDLSQLIDDKIGVVVKEMDKQYEKAKEQGEVVVPEEGLMDLSEMGRYAPYNMSSNFGRRVLKDAIEVREAIFNDDSYIKEAVKILGGVIVGAAIYHFASSQGGGGGGGGSSLPDSPLMIDFVTSIEPMTVLHIFGL